MKTSILTLAAVIGLAGLANAQNPKFGYAKPEVRKSTTTAATCPMTTKTRVNHVAVFTKSGAGVDTKTTIKHDASCPMARGATNCP